MFSELQSMWYKAGPNPLFSTVIDVIAPGSISNASALCCYYGGYFSGLPWLMH